MRVPLWFCPSLFRARTTAFVLLLIVALAVVLSAQFRQGVGQRFRLPEGERAYPPRYPPETSRTARS